MATWKKILLEGQQTNLGDSDLTQTDTTRTFDTGAEQRFKITGDIPSSHTDRTILDINNTTAATDFSTRAIYTLGEKNGQPVHTEARLMAGNRNKLGLHEDNGFYEGPSFFFNTVDTTPHSVRIEYFDSGGAHGPMLKLSRKSASPNNNDLIGTIDFTGNSDSSGTEVTFARIQGEIAKEGGTSDIGVLNFFARAQGDDITDADVGTSDLRLMSDMFDPSNTNISERTYRRGRVSFAGDSLGVLTVKSLYEKYAFTQSDPTVSITSNGSTSPVSTMLSYEGIPTGGSLGAPMYADRNHIVAVNVSYKIDSTNTNSTTNNGKVRIEILRNGGTTQGDVLFDTDSTTTGINDHTFESSGQQTNIQTAHRYAVTTTDQAGGYLAKNNFFSVRLTATGNDGSKNFSISRVLCHVVVYQEIT